MALSSEAGLRNLMLRMADSPRLMRFLAKQGMRTGFAKRFIAGDTLGEAIEAVKELNRHDISASLDLLGEGVTEESDARHATEEYITLLTTIRDHRVDSNISIKLTQLGLNINRELCCDNLQRILEVARRENNFVRIDMEDSPHTQSTVEIFQDHFRRFGNHVGIVLQSYLYRSAEDVSCLRNLGCNIRLCKGAYKEPAEVAFPKKEDVDRSYGELLEALLRSETYTAIATHDPKMIDHAKTFIADNGIPDSRYEFQMLYGIRREMQIALRREGFKMRVYVPFGTQWAPYFVRRLAERPANVFFVLKNFLRK